MVKAVLELPGVKTVKTGIDSTPLKGADRLYAICRRLAQRVSDLERRVSTLNTTMARIDRRDYRVAAKAREEAEVHQGDNGPGDDELGPHGHLFFGDEVKDGNAS